VIQARGITKRYLDGIHEVIAVNQADIIVNKGDFILVVGRSGSGKSTFIGMLGGLIRPSEGSVLLEGDEIWALPDTRLSRIRAKKLGFVFQFSGLIPTLTALENVMVPSLFCGDDSPCQKRAADLLESFSLLEKMDSYPSQLSGGELKRVAIARALINDPHIIFADEPTGDLDVTTERIIMEYFGEINRMGKTIILVAHSTELSSYANKVFSMERGKISDIGHDPMNTMPGLVKI
jgi:putative ABC transport system ATP-binding protein